MLVMEHISNVYLYGVSLVKGFGHRVSSKATIDSDEIRSKEIKTFGYQSRSNSTVIHMTWWINVQTVCFGFSFLQR